MELSGLLMDSSVSEGGPNRDHHGIVSYSQPCRYRVILHRDQFEEMHMDSRVLHMP